MRPSLAILGLLLRLIATCAEQLPEIKDSEAIHYVGKNVEARGFAYSLCVWLGKRSSVTESLNRPQRKRLSYFNVRISEVNKVKPAAVIGTDVGFVLPEYKGVE